MAKVDVQWVKVGTDGYKSDSSDYSGDAIGAVSLQSVQADTLEMHCVQ